MKPDLIVMFGPSPFAPETVMDRLLDVVEAAGGQLGRWYAEVRRDALEQGDDDFSVIHEASDLAGRDDLRARIRRNGSGQASYWSGRMLSGDEYALVFEDPPPNSPEAGGELGDLDPTELRLLQALDRGDDDAAVAVYADWLEETGHADRAELLRLRGGLAARRPDGEAAHDPSVAARLRALVRSVDLDWRSRVHANTTVILHLAASTSSPWSSGVARFVDPDPGFDDFRRETIAGFEAMAIAIEVTHFIAGEYLDDWRRFDADRFLDGPTSEFRPRHLAWRRDAFALSEVGVWGNFTPAMVEHGPVFDHARCW